MLVGILIIIIEIWYNIFVIYLFIYNCIYIAESQAAALKVTFAKPVVTYNQFKKVSNAVYKDVSFRSAPKVTGFDAGLLDAIKGTKSKDTSPL